MNRTSNRPSQPKQMSIKGLKSSHVMPQIGQRWSTLIINGEFTADSNWTKGTGWSIASGKATASGTGSSALTAAVAPLVANHSYAVTFRVVAYTSGDIAAYCGTQAGTTRTALGTYKEVITAAATGAFKFQDPGTAGFTGSIDEVSVVEQ